MFKYCVLDIAGGINNSFDLVNFTSVPDLGWNLNVMLKFVIN